MPIINVALLEGRSTEAKAALIRRLTDAAVEAIGAPPETVRVLLTEVPPEHWGTGGVSKAASNKEARHG
jgi:4-oxalocrotonate tautomerase